MEQARAIIKEKGMTMTDAISLFIEQIVLEQDLPIKNCRRFTPWTIDSRTTSPIWTRLKRIWIRTRNFPRWYEATIWFIKWFYLPKWVKQLTVFMITLLLFFYHLSRLKILWPKFLDGLKSLETFPEAGFDADEKIGLKINSKYQQEEKLSAIYLALLYRSNPKNCFSYPLISHKKATMLPCYKAKITKTQNHHFDIHCSLNSLVIIKNTVFILTRK